MKVLFTGASSFTGYWFVQELVAVGHEIIATFTAPYESYQGLKKKRIDLLPNTCRKVFSCPFGSPAFLELLAATKDISALCHHGANVTDYKSFHYGTVAAVAENTLNVVPVLQILKENSCRGLILTGSIFEQNEGIGNNKEAFSPYGLAKGITSEIFRYYCNAFKLRFRKFVIPNPFGPYEEPRFISYLMKQWFADKVAVVNTPDYIRDNIHVSLLAKAYGVFSSSLSDDTPAKMAHPSGYIMSQGAFSRKLAEEMRPRLGKSCDVELAKQVHFDEPLIRINMEAASTAFDLWHESAAFDSLATYYLEMHHEI